MIKYVITNGKDYIRKENGKYVPVRNAKLGERFDSLYKAKMVLNHCVNKKYRKYEVAEVEDDECDSCAEIVLNAMKTSENELDVGKLAKCIEDMKYDLIKLEHLRDDLLERVSDIDKQLSDIRHFIEFNLYETSLEFDVFRLEKAKCDERRALKDQVYIINTVLNGEINTIHSDTIFDIASQLNTRKYTPRVLTELFSRDGAQSNKKVHIGGKKDAVLF